MWVIMRQFGFSSNRFLSGSPSSSGANIRVASLKLSKVRLLSKEEAALAPKGLPVLTPALLNSAAFRSGFFDSSNAMVLAKKKHLPLIMEKLTGEPSKKSTTLLEGSNHKANKNHRARELSVSPSQKNALVLDADNALSITLSNAIDKKAFNRDSWKEISAPSFAKKIDEMAIQSGEVDGQRSMSPDEKLIFALAESGEDTSLRTFLSECRSADDQLDLDFNHPIHGGTALHVAAVNGHENVVLTLLENGATIDSRAKNGSTPLHWASGSGNMSTVRLLLENGANPRMTTYTWNTALCGRGSGQTPVHWAAESGHADLIELFSEFDPVSVMKSDERSESPKSIAQKANQGVSAKLLEEFEEEEYVVLHLEEELSAQKIVS